MLMIIWPRFVRPLYRELFASSIGRKTAVDTFAEWQANYHPIAAKMLAQDLKVQPPGYAPSSPAAKGLQVHQLWQTAVVVAAVATFAMVVKSSMTGGR